MKEFRSWSLDMAEPTRRNFGSYMFPSYASCHTVDLVSGIQVPRCQRHLTINRKDKLIRLMSVLL